MFVVINAALTKPGDYSYLVRQLQLLKHIPKNSIPSPIASFASKIVLAHAFSSGDWKLASNAFEQWNTPGYNAISKYFIGSKFDPNRPVSQQGTFVAILEKLAFPGDNIIPENELLEWAKSSIDRSKNKYLNKYEPSTSRSEIILQLIKSASASDLKLNDQSLNYLISQLELTKWKERAEVLGVWDVDHSLSLLMASVKSHSIVKCNEPPDKKSAESTYLEKQQKALHYVARSIDKSINPAVKGVGSEHLRLWLTYLEILESLSVEKQSQITGLVITHNTIWDWITKLRSDRNENSLSGWIANHCLIIARNTELSDFQTYLRYVTTH